MIIFKFITYLWNEAKDWRDTITGLILLIVVSVFKFILWVIKCIWILLVIIIPIAIAITYFKEGVDTAWPAIWVYSIYLPFLCFMITKLDMVWVQFKHKHDQEIQEKERELEFLLANKTSSNHKDLFGP